MLNEEELRDAALLVFANKQDQPGSKGAGEISEALNLGELRDRNWSIVVCSAVDGRGVNEGMDWLVVSRSVAFGDGAACCLWSGSLIDRCDSKQCSRSRDMGCLIGQFGIFERVRFLFEDCLTISEAHEFYDGQYHDRNDTHITTSLVFHP